MSGYKPYRGLNVSQYVANLNQPSPPQDLFAESNPTEEDFSAFLNADFLDINNSGSAQVDLNSSLNFDLDIDTAHTQPKTDEKSPRLSLDASVDPNMDFNLNGTCF